MQVLLAKESLTDRVTKGVPNRDIFWLRDKIVEDSDNLPDPGVLAQEIVVPRLASLGTTPSQDPRPARGPRRGVEDLETALELFREIATDLRGQEAEPEKG
jgi:type I restriction enzyme M protein